MCPVVSSRRYRWHQWCIAGEPACKDSLKRRLLQTHVMLLYSTELHCHAEKKSYDNDIWTSRKTWCLKNWDVAVIWWHQRWVAIHFAETEQKTKTMCHGLASDWCESNTPHLCTYQIHAKDEIKSEGSFIKSNATKIGCVLWNRISLEPPLYSIFFHPKHESNIILPDCE